MRASLPMVLVSVFCAAIYAGCGARAPGAMVTPTPPDTSPGSLPHTGRPSPEPGGRVRILMSGRWTSETGSARDDLDRFLIAATGQGLLGRDPDGETGPRLASAGGPETNGIHGAEWRFEIDPTATWPDGNPVRAEDVVASWKRALRLESSPARWLLAPVAGALPFALGEADAVDGLQAEDGVLVVRLVHPTPDLRERLTHPSLTVWRSGVDPGLRGTGPFRATPDDSAFLAVAGRTLLERVDVVDASTSEAKLLARLGEVDVAVVYGRTASAFLDDVEPSEADRFTVERLEAWDRFYFLVLSPSARWTRDPAFRHWMSDAIDRTSMMRYLFDGLGAWPCDLLWRCSDEAVAHDNPTIRWRVPNGVRPRIALTFDPHDRIASDIAARIKADLADAGVGIDLDPRSRDDLDRELRSGRLQAALVFRRSWTPDPVLTLLDTLHAASPGPGDAGAALIDAVREPPASGSRAVAADAVQERILREATIVPVARIDAWIVTAPGLALDPGVSPSLDIAHAGWLP